jgi:hypothetical protein
MDLKKCYYCKSFIPSFKDSTTVELCETGLCVLVGDPDFVFGVKRLGECSFGHNSKDALTKKEIEIRDKKYLDDLIAYENNYKKVRKEISTWPKWMKKMYDITY